MSWSALLLDPSSPLTQSWVLAIIGLIWLALRRYRIGAGLLAISALWLGLCATPIFADWLQDGLQSCYPERAAASYPKADAIVVLGGGLLPPAGNDADDDMAKIEATRVGFGLELFKAGRARVLLISGDSHESERHAKAGQNSRCYIGALIASSLDCLRPLSPVALPASLCQPG